MAKRNGLQDAKKEMWESRIRELEVELAEARRDVARMDWLEFQVGSDNVRAAIDAAMKEGK